MDSKRKLISLVAGLVLIGGGFSEPALARGRGGARSAPAAGRAQPKSGTFQRQGTATGSQGKTGTYQGQGSWQRGEGTYNRQYEGTRTGPNGNTQQVNRQQNVTRTGENTYKREGSQSVTGADGQTRTRSHSGEGSVQKTDDGYTRSYDGTVTNSKGQTVNVDREVDVSKNADGTVTKERSTEVSSPEGTPLRSGESTTVITPGQGSQTSGSHTNHVNGGTSTYEGSSTRTEGGLDHQGSWTGPQGNTRTQNARVRWQYVDGRWVRMVEGSNSHGGTVQSTTTGSPNPQP